MHVCVYLSVFLIFHAVQFIMLNKVFQCAVCIFERIVKNMPDFSSSTTLLWTTTDGRNDNSTTAILNVAEYLTTYLGQRYRSTMTAVSLSIVYGLVLMTGVLGNVITCVVIARNSYMHTATNYYLFSLAISDMLCRTSASVIIIIIIIIIITTTTISDVLSLVFGKQIVVLLINRLIN